MRKIETIDSLIGALDRDVPAVLVIVVETAGSAPREPGAWMAVFDDGRIEGTVGGGALEARAIEDARLLLASGGSRLVRYTIGGAQSDTGMVCGGAVELLFMRMGGEHRLMLEKMTAMFGARSEGVFAIDLAAFGGSLGPGKHGPDAPARCRALRACVSSALAMGAPTGRCRHVVSRADLPRGSCVRFRVRTCGSFPRRGLGVRGIRGRGMR